MKSISISIFTSRNSRFLPFILAIFAFLSCSKEKFDPNHLLNANGYPDGFTVVDLTTPSDCSLPPCSEERVERLALKDVVGLLSPDSMLSVTLSFDSFMYLPICNADSLDIEINPGRITWVVFSGKAKDACGYYVPQYPVEEVYFIHVTKIQRL